MEKKFQGNTLKLLRTYQHLSTTDLSEKTGISRNQLTLLESGKSSRPRYKTIEKIADALSVPIKILYKSFDEESKLIEHLKIVDEILSGDSDRADKAILNVETILRNCEKHELKEVEFRFPCPFNPNDNYDLAIDYYHSKAKEEQEKLSFMLRMLKSKYNLPDEGIKEIERLAENIGLLKEYVLNIKISKELYLDVIS
ncbi:helix-turn-helix domain-containing protein [Anaerosinus massiliensis]|uniref:helix-turn-helix domain-containing protein n=1 Tax=Massilibacillus massiliensis TaxID=1806837 RepID=UPI000DA5FC94|nr:helix-turn-helix transcriptional regulator [Massilibacillus massiliensis]